MYGSRDGRDGTCQPPPPRAGPLGKAQACRHASPTIHPHLSRRLRAAQRWEDSVGAAGFTKRPGQESTPRPKPTQEEQSSPQFRNYRTLGTSLHSLMPTAFPFFQTIGKALLPRRERDSTARSHHLAMKARKNLAAGAEPSSKGPSGKPEFKQGSGRLWVA